MSLFYQQIQDKIWERSFADPDYRQQIILWEGLTEEQAAILTRVFTNIYVTGKIHGENHIKGQICDILRLR